MKKLSNYNLPEGREIYYIKKFVNGVTKEELKYMFLSGIAKAIFNVGMAGVAMEIATSSLKRSNLM